MDLITNLNPVLTPGQRLLTVKGYEAVEKYPMPRDCHAAFWDEDEDYVYIKRTDANGGATVDRFGVIPDPIPKFDPKKYVTIDDFNALKEEIANGFSSLQQSIANTGRQEYPKQGNSRGSGKQNSGIGESSGNI